MSNFFGSFNYEFLKQNILKKECCKFDSYSLGRFYIDDESSKVVVLNAMDVRNEELNLEFFKNIYEKDEFYIIGFNTKKTNNQESFSILGKSCLWLDGDVSTNNSDTEKETNWLIKKLDKNDYDFLNNVDGNYSFVFYNGENLYLYRTEGAKLYFDDEFNFSTAEFANSKLLKPCTFLRLNFADPSVPYKEEMDVKNNLMYDFPITDPREEIAA